MSARQFPIYEAGVPNLDGLGGGVCGYLQQQVSEPEIAWVGESGRSRGCTLVLRVVNLRQTVRRCFANREGLTALEMIRMMQWWNQPCCLQFSPFLTLLHRERAGSEVRLCLLLPVIMLTNSYLQTPVFSFCSMRIVTTIIILFGMSIQWSLHVKILTWR